MSLLRLLLLLLILPQASWAQCCAGWGRDTDSAGGRLGMQVEGGAAEFTLQVTEARFDILRNEISRRGVARIGGEYTYDFRQYVPDDFAVSPLYLETAQFLPDGQQNSAHAGWGPVLDIGIERGRWKLHVSQDVRGHEERRELDLGAVTRNRWTPFRVEVKWSPNSDGWVRVLKDGRVVFARQGATTFTSTEIPYFKTGLYTRRRWTQGDGPAPLDRFRIRHAGLSVNGSGGGGDSPPPEDTPPPVSRPPEEPDPGGPPLTPPWVGQPEAPDTAPEAPEPPPVQIPETPPLPTWRPPQRPPPVVVREPQTPPTYSAGTGAS